MTIVSLRCESFNSQLGQRKERPKLKQLGNCSTVPLHHNLMLPEGLVD